MLNSSAQSTVIPRTVLVVEDEPTLATAIAQRITAEGWTARVASDGASAVQAASTLRPDFSISLILINIITIINLCAYSSRHLLVHILHRSPL